MLTHVYRHRVRYRECDPMGVVYHTHYLDYFEAARTEALREAGLAYRKLEESGVIMPVIEAHVDYKGSARYDDLLDVTAQLEAPTPARVPTRYEVRRAGEEALLATGHVTLCFMDAARRRPVRAPEAVRAVFEKAVAS